MNIETTSDTITTSQQAVRRATIVDAPIRPMPYPRKGNWQPREIRIIWERSRTEGTESTNWTDWEAWRGAVVTGPLIRKDGSESVVVVNDGHLHDGDPEFGEWIAQSRPAVNGATTTEEREGES